MVPKHTFTKGFAGCILEAFLEDRFLGIIGAFHDETLFHLGASRRTHRGPANVCRRGRHGLSDCSGRPVRAPALVRVYAALESDPRFRGRLLLQVRTVTGFPPSRPADQFFSAYDLWSELRARSRECDECNRTRPDLFDSSQPPLAPEQRHLAHTRYSSSSLKTSDGRRGPWKRASTETRPALCLAQAVRRAPKRTRLETRETELIISKGEVL